MKKNEKNLILMQLYLDLCDLKIPDSPENHELEEWIDNLFLIDSYYAGLALSATEGERIDSRQLYDIKNLKNKLANITKLSSKDNLIKESCENYIAVIEKIDFLLRK